MIPFTNDQIEQIYSLNIHFVQQFLDFTGGIMPVVLALMITMMAFSFCSFLIWGAYNIGRPSVREKFHA